MPQSDERRSRRIQSLDRAVALLRAIAASQPGTATVSALAQRCAINPSTAWRLLTTLEHHGIVERDPIKRTYEIGFITCRLSRAVGTDGLVRRCHATIEKIAATTRETASIAVALAAPGLVYVDQVTATPEVSADWRGRRAPLHATSSGKAYLATLARDEIEATLPDRLERYTSTTITDRHALQADLARARARGYATCAGELEATCWGVSAPVLDARGTVEAIIGIWGPSRSVTPPRFAALGKVIAAAAHDLQARLNLPPRT